MSKTARTLTANVTPALTVAALITFTICSSKRAPGEDTFSPWTSSSGKDHIQYRWKKTGGTDYGSCDLEFRNLRDDDRTAYKGKIGYTFKQNDETAPISILKFPYAGSIQYGSTYGSCTRVSDVWLTSDQ